MTLESALAENTASNTAVAAALAAHSGLLEKVVVNQERLLAGQQLAIDKVEAATAGGTTAAGTRKRRTAAEIAADEAAAKAAADKAAEQPKEPTTEDTTALAAELRTTLTDWLAAVKKGSPEHGERGSFMVAVFTNFGAAKVSDIKDADALRQAIWFVKRKIAGKDVDFKVDYDFDSDPTQSDEGGGAADFDIG